MRNQIRKGLAIVESYNKYDSESWVYHPSIGFAHGTETHAEISHKHGLKDFDRSHRGTVDISHSDKTVDINFQDTEDGYLRAPLRYNDVVSHYKKRFPGYTVS